MLLTVFIFADGRSAAQPQPKTKARSETQRNRVSRGIGKTKAKAKPKATPKPEEKPENKQGNLSRLGTNPLVSNADQTIGPRINANKRELEERNEEKTIRICVKKTGNEH